MGQNPPRSVTSGRSESPSRQRRRSRNQTHHHQHGETETATHHSTLGPEIMVPLNDTDDLNGLPPPPSFPDQLAAAALQTTLGFLKAAGGFTLSTTGALVAPPLHATRTVLLPQLLQAIAELYQSRTPERWQDWADVAATSIAGLGSLFLDDTPQAHRLRKAAANGCRDAGHAAATPAARQCGLEVFAAVVRTADLYQSEPVQDWIRTLVRTYLRILRFLASPPMQQVLWDAVHMAAAGSALISHPATVEAAAHIVAHIVHILEVESNGSNSNDANNKTNNSNNSTIDQRQRRNRTARESHPTPYDLTNTSEADGVTVEQAILASLGMDPATIKPTTTTATATASSMPPDPTSGERTNHAHASTSTTTDIPHSVVVEDGNDNHSHSGVGSTSLWPPDDDDERSIRELLDDEEHEHDNPKSNIGQTADAAPVAVDTALLRAGIRQRPIPSPPSFLSIPDIEGNPNDNETRSADPVVETVRSSRSQVDLDPSDRSDALPTTAQSGNKLDGPSDYGGNGNDQENSMNDDNDNNEIDSSAVEHFHRILNQALADRRTQALASMLDDESKARAWLTRPGVAVRKSGNDAEKGNDQESPESFRDQLQRVRASLSPAPPPPRPDRFLAVVQNHRKLVYGGIFIILYVIVVVLGLALYGAYALVVLRTATHAAAPMVAASASSADAQEVVIRVIRQVVHVDKDQQVIAPTSGRRRGGKSLPESTTVVSAEGVDKLTECIAQAL